jgi:hypothetical protein
MADTKDDLEMFRFLDALMAFDPKDDADFIDVAEDGSEFDMHDSDALEEEAK